MKHLFRFTRGIGSVIVLLILTGSLLNAQTAVSLRDTVLQISKQQVGNFTGSIPVHLLPDYGFRSVDELKQISFGEPLPVYRSENKTIVFEDTWRVPLIIGNEYRALLTICKDKGLWQATELGAVEMAAELQKKMTPQVVGLLRSYVLRADYLIEKRADDQLDFTRVIE